jgi:predicted phosphodiesterase
LWYRHTLRLEGEKKLIALAEELHVPYILAGHTHISHSYQVANKKSTAGIRVICASSPICVGTRAPSFWELYIQVQNNKIVELQHKEIMLREFTNKSTGQSVYRFVP